jgi:tetratricopeptide (TPR) repeat protein
VVTVTAERAHPAGFRADLAAVRSRRREREVTADPASPTAATEVLTLRHREVVLAGGRPEELLTLGTAVDRAVEQFPAWPDLRVLRATIALAVHRPDVAAAALDAVPGLAELPPGRVVAADIAQLTGDYRAARAGYRRAAREDPLWDTTARLAALAVATGDCDEADALYAEAEDEITVKQMRAFAWVRVQRADLAQALGDLDRAGGLLADADRAYPDWWYVNVHCSALDAAAGRPDRAAAGYRSVIAQVDRPEFVEALGTAHLATGHTDRAAVCHGLALSAYLASVARGEVHYLHHLAAFHADVRPHAAAAVAWAQQDAALRRNGTTLSLLAWCLHRAGRRDEALAVVEEAFALGAGDPLLQARAREIRRGRRA